MRTCSVRKPAMKEAGPGPWSGGDGFVLSTPTYGGQSHEMVIMSDFPAVEPGKCSGSGRAPRPAPLHCRCWCLDRGGDRLALVDREPAASVGAHVLDQRDQGAALVRELVGHARGDLGEGPALDDAVLLELAQSQREGARADALERALQLTEPKRGIREVADDQQGPLAGDDFRRPADGTFAIQHAGEDSAKALLCEALRRDR